MTLDFVLVPLGILCLGVPASLFTTSKVKEKMRNVARRREDCLKALGRLATTPVNWIDLARAGAGAWIIQHAFSSVKPGQDELALTYLVAKIAVIALCAVAQTIWLDRPLRVIGPLFYLTSLVFIFCGPLVAGFAVTLGFGCALILRHLSLLFILVPGGLLGFGALFGELSPTSIVVTAAFALPAFLSFALRTRIAYACRPAILPMPLIRVSEPNADVPEAPTENVISPDFSSESIEISDGFVA
jgi:hypothetical protein